MEDERMGVDDVKGKAKEAVGEVTGDEDLEREGKLDQIAGKVKDKVEDLKDKATDLLDRDKDK